MVATPLAVTDRYVAPETTKTYLVDSIASISAPTRVELDAGTDLTAEIATATGWATAAANVAVPDGGTLFTAQIPGRVTPEDATIAFYASLDTQDVRTVIARGDTTHIVLLYGGDVEGQHMDVWPVKVRSVSKPIDYAASGAMMVNIQFSPTAEPAEDVLIPAA